MAIWAFLEGKIIWGIAGVINVTICIVILIYMNNTSKQMDKECIEGFSRILDIIK
ncbi:MAG: hypothetical protein KIC92_05890 [Clostridiales bacterium]|nr:hypothetical protein [Clostridiales bacterium]